MNNLSKGGRSLALLLTTLLLGSTWLTASGTDVTAPPPDAPSLEIPIDQHPPESDSQSPPIREESVTLEKPSTLEEPVNLEEPPSLEEPIATEETHDNPAQSDPAQGCATIADLVALLDQDPGGVISVAADLTVPAGENLLLQAERPVTISLGTFGITVPADTYLTIAGPITLTGQGSPRPLVEVTGGLTTGEGADFQAQGVGARAVSLLSPDSWWFARQTTAQVIGQGACVLDSQTEALLQLDQVHFTAQGEDSLCVRSKGPVLAICSVLESDGLLAQTPHLTLDATQAQPVPHAATVLQRYAVIQTSLPENGLWLPAGSSQDDLDDLLDWLQSQTWEYQLYPEGEGYPYLHFAALSWTWAPVELQQPGVFAFTGQPTPGTLGNVDLPDLSFYLHVADESLPGLEAGSYLGGEVTLQFYRPIQGAEEVALWYSSDQGKTWQNADQLPGGEITSTGALFPDLPEGTYLFRLEVIGGPMAGTSNTLRVLCYDTLSGAGGDRDGDDRDSQLQRPPTEQLPPPTEPETPSRPSGGGANRPKPNPDPAPLPDAEPVIESPPAADPAPVIDPIPAPTPEPIPEPTPAQPDTVLPSTPVLLSQEPKPSIAPPPPAASTQTPTAPPTVDLPQGATHSLTGRDLAAQQKANPAGVTLIGAGLKVTLPYAFTDTLDLNPDSVLAARLDMPEEHQFEVRFWVDGVALTQFEGDAIAVALPIQAGEGAEIFCSDGQDTLPARDWDGQAAIFDLTAPGLYTVGISPGPEAAQAEEAPAETASLPLGPLAGGGGLLLLVGGLILHRRRKGGSP